jgi:hypothetical protein
VIYLRSTSVDRPCVTERSPPEPAMSPASRSRSKTIDCKAFRARAGAEASGRPTQAGARRGARVGRGVARGVSEEARPGAHARAVRRAPLRRAARAPRPHHFVVQEHWARNLHFDLRPRARGRAQELGGAQGPIGARRGEAARGARRGPPDRVRELRGHHPLGQLRRGLRDRVGPRALRLVQARGTCASSMRAARWSSSCSATSSAGAGRWCA